MGKDWVKKCVQKQFPIKMVDRHDCFWLLCETYHCLDAKSIRLMMMIFYSCLVTLLSNTQCTRSMKRKRDTTTNFKHAESTERVEKEKK